MQRKGSGKECPLLGGEQEGEAATKRRKGPVGQRASFNSVPNKSVPSVYSKVLRPVGNSVTQRRNSKYTAWNTIGPDGT